MSFLFLHIVSFHWFSLYCIALRSLTLAPEAEYKISNTTTEIYRDRKIEREREIQRKAKTECEREIGRQSNKK